MASAFPRAAKHPYWATTSCPRRRTQWAETFGQDALPIESPFAHGALGPDDQVRWFYHLALDLLEPAQRRQVIAANAKNWKLSAAEVERALADSEHGLPILADGVEVEFRVSVASVSS